ncbi:pseudaminic acid synthase [bacterium]|nr:pseudaminic acid synthase [bacterium]|tara:strand:+ start:2805 stop:3854 length:1050 start_codon:yes stop_codon:yes gene_type:complete
MKKKIVINGREIGDSCPPYIIAEMSANHNGSIERAIETIDEAARCGVDAIKLQTYTADTMTIDCDNEEFILRGGLWDGYKLYDLYKWAETPFEWHKKLFDHANNIGVTIFSTPFDESAVDLLESLETPAYKIASFEIVDIPLIKYISKKQKPIIMSTGMASEDEIHEAVQAVRSQGNDQLILLHCISSYPTPLESANLKQLPNLSKKFNSLTGLSDHTLGINVAVTSIALGASVVEKHFTLSRKDKGPDSEFSIEPDELKRLCVETNNAWKSLGNEGFERDRIEDSSKIYRRSIYFVKDKNVGETINKEDIKRIRPGYGLNPKYLDDLIGNKLKRNVKRGTPTAWDLVE